MYYRAPHQPSAHDRELIRMATHLAGIVIERARAVEQLRIAKIAAEERAQEIKRAYDSLRTTQETLNAELAGALDYVLALLPRPITEKHVSVDWCVTFSAQLGGDGLGYHWVDPDRFAFYLLDVSGHGVKSALLAVSILDTLRTCGLAQTDWNDPGAVLGALNRVYINIGLFSEQWLLHFRAVLGGRPISPIPIETAVKNSVYWRATEMQTPNMARFFLASTDPHYLKDAPGGQTYLDRDAAMVPRGKLVFAERCARCHSSKLPELPAGLYLDKANGPNYLSAWNAYWAWSKTEAFKAEMRKLVVDEHFLDGNFLSTELRVPVTLLGINACSPLATNAIRDNIWDNFSSESYKSLPSVGSIKIRHPVTGKESDYPLPAGGRGYIRPASLVSLWSTSPFLQNNTVGPFYTDPSVATRMRGFDISIRQMLWPDEREKDPIFKDEKGPGVGVIDRVTVDSYLDIPEGYIPEIYSGLISLSRVLVPTIGGTGRSVKIGPFPKGFPIGLMANMDLLGSDLSPAERDVHRKKLLTLLDHAKAAMKTEKDFGAVLNRLVDDMLEVSKCKDFVVNKGHYFGTEYFSEEPGLSNEDKSALIAFLKTF